MVALDLFAALEALQLRGRARVVLAEVLLQCYGPRKFAAAVLDPPTIEQDTGLHRNNVRAGITELVAAGILTRTSDGRYRFEKDYDRWAPGQKLQAERLGGGLARFAHSAKVKYGLRINDQANTPIQTDIASTITPIQTDCLSTNTPIQTDCGAKEVRARQKTSEDLRSAAAAPRARAPSPKSRTFVVPPAWAESLHATLDVCRRCFPGSGLDAELMGDVEDLGRALDGDFGFYAAAVRQAWHKPGGVGNVHGYAAVTAKAWHAEGRIPERIAGKGSGSPPPPSAAAERLRVQKEGFAERRARRLASSGSANGEGARHD